MTEDAIVHEITYPHPISRVWRALTDSRALAAWLMPNDFVPQVGHRFSFRVDPQPGWGGVVNCRVVTLDAPREIAYTWQGGGGELPETLVTFTLSPVEGGTLLKLVHSGFAAGGPPALTIRDILAQGWRSNLLNVRLPALLDQLAQEDQA